MRFFIEIEVDIGKGYNKIVGITAMLSGSWFILLCDQKNEPRQLGFLHEFY